MVTLWVSAIVPVVRVMVWPARLDAKVIGSSLSSSATAARSEPGPLSLVLLTKYGWLWKEPMSYGPLVGNG